MTRSPASRTQIREAVAAVHERGVLHNDIHEGNVLRDSRTFGRPRLNPFKIIDFTHAAIPIQGETDFSNDLQSMDDLLGVPQGSPEVSDEGPIKWGCGGEGGPSRRPHDILYWLFCVTLLGVQVLWLLPVWGTFWLHWFSLT